jgi:hypothetical protein
MPIKLTQNQTVLLLDAARREDRCFVLPLSVKGGAAQKVAAKLIAGGLAKEIRAKENSPIWRRDAESERAYSLKSTAAGVKAVTLSEAPGGSAAPVSSMQEPIPDSKDSSEACGKVAEVGKAAPREGSKLASVMALLRRSEGATIDVLTKATGWLPHTTRAAITGVRKRGYSVALERSAEGASIYRLSSPQGSEAGALVIQGEGEEKKVAPRQRESKAKSAA